MAAVPLAAWIVLFYGLQQPRAADADRSTTLEDRSRAAWDLSRALAPASTALMRVHVGVADTGGVPAAAAARWTNAAEVPGNDLDDDKNRYVDDAYGLSALSGFGMPLDVADGAPDGRGARLADIAATEGAGEVVIIPCKCLNADGRGFADECAECIDYLVAMGADLVVAAWRGDVPGDDRGGVTASPLYRAVENAAGNGSANKSGASVLAATYGQDRALNLPVAAPSVLAVDTSDSRAVAWAANTAALFLRTARALGSSPDADTVAAVMRLHLSEQAAARDPADVVYAALGYHLGARAG